MKTYLIQGLAPGESYHICLKTVTGSGSKEHVSRKELEQTVLTQPMPLDWILVEAHDDENHDKVTLLLNAPDNHSKLKGFDLLLKEIDGENKKVVRSMTVLIEKDDDMNPKDITRTVIDKLDSGKEYEVIVKALCACINPEILNPDIFKQKFGRQKTKINNSSYGRQMSKFSTSTDISLGWNKYLISLSTEKITRFTTKTIA